MAVAFQASQLTVLDYNRVVKDLNGNTSEQFLEKLARNFTVEKKARKNIVRRNHMSSHSILMVNGIL